MLNDWSRRGAMTAGLALSLAPRVARAQALPSPAHPSHATVSVLAPAAPTASPAPAPQTLDDLVTLDISEDGAGRLTVPVTVNGRGPFPFMIDTGSDHSVLSEELAAMLALPEASPCRVHDIAGSQMRPRAEVARLEVGGRALSNAPMALLPRRYLGALGYVGLDGLKDQRLTIDFARAKMEVRRSRGFEAAPNEIVVHGRSRFGQLLLVDSSVRRRSVYVILDSGAQDTIGNLALRAFVEERRRVSIGGSSSGAAIELSSVTGQTLIGEGAQMTDLTLGGVQMRRIPVVYADLHTFRMFKLDNDPALMLGMNTLRAFAAVKVDFGRREIGFELPKDAATA